MQVDPSDGIPKPKPDRQNSNDFLSKKHKEIKHIHNIHKPKSELIHTKPTQPPVAYTHGSDGIYSIVAFTDRV